MEERKRQNKFRELGLLNLVARFIKSDVIPEKMLLKAMKLGISLVDGGNLESQSHLINYLRSNECGDHEGHFFKHINDIIHEGITWYVVDIHTYAILHMCLILI
jgi:hypothetical protein